MAFTAIGLSSCGGSDPVDGSIFQRDQDDKLLNEYFTANSLSPTKTTSGLYYIIHEAGSGQNPNITDTASLHYTGTLLNGDIFDTSLNNEDSPAELVIGQTVPGFIEGLLLSRAGTKMTIYLPSHLGYGTTARSGISANSVLIFDLDIFEFK